jgi:hypothetical protein
MQANCVTDRYDNAFAGFTGKETWRFNTNEVTNAISPNTEFALYPNPTQEWLYLNVPATRMFIYNALGQILGEYQNVSVISLVHLPKGIYFAKIQTQQNDFVTLKIIKE